MIKKKDQTLIETEIFGKTRTSLIPQPPYYPDEALSNCLIFPILKSTLPLVTLVTLVIIVVV
jgi:hypothetical protein